MNHLLVIIQLLIFSFFLMYCNNTNRENEDKTLNDRASISDEANSFNESLTSNSEIVGLLYHRFDEAENPSTSISSALFEKHLQFLQKQQIEVLSLEEAVVRLRDKSDSNRYAVITVDDAFRSFYEKGYPLLKEYGVKATLFVNTETVGNGDYLNWNELKELREYGIEIGNHTHSHAYFLDKHDSIRNAYLKRDVIKAQQLIRENLGIEAKVFAFPYGEYDTAMQRTVKELGFICAAAQHSGVISKYSGLYALPRFPMTDQYGRIDLFMEKIFMSPLPVTGSSPGTTIPAENPPVLSIYLEENNLDLSRLQCFIQGSECVIVDYGTENNEIIIKAEDLLKNRRHLYTVTIPSRTSGKWYWYSHQWVFTSR